MHPITTLLKAIILPSIVTAAVVPSELRVPVPDSGSQRNDTNSTAGNFSATTSDGVNWVDWSFQADRFCQTKLQGEYGYQPWHKNHIMVYVRDWQTIPSGECGKGFLDNLRDRKYPSGSVLFPHTLQRPLALIFILYQVLRWLTTMLEQNADVGSQTGNAGEESPQMANMVSSHYSPWSRFQVSTKRAPWRRPLSSHPEESMATSRKRCSVASLETRGVICKPQVILEVRGVILVFWNHQKAIAQFTRLKIF